MPYVRLKAKLLILCGSGRDDVICSSLEQCNFRCLMRILPKACGSVLVYISFMPFRIGSRHAIHLLAFSLKIKPILVSNSSRSAALVAVRVADSPKGVRKYRRISVVHSE